MGGGIGHLVLSGPLILAVPVAAAAGAVTFLSPCVLPLVPGYLSYVAGMSGWMRRPPPPPGMAARPRDGQHGPRRAAPSRQAAWPRTPTVSRGHQHRRDQQHGRD